MLRLFFGLYTISFNVDWWTVFSGDNLLSQNTWGKLTTLSGKSINPVKRHTPYVVPSGTYDEYVDLYYSVVEPIPAEYFAQFTNQAGITIPYPITALTGAAHNLVEVDGDLAEWFTPTRMLSQVFPPVTDPVYLNNFWAVNATMENDPTLPIVGYVSLAAAIKSGTDYGFAPDPVIVPYNQLTDDIRCMWQVPAGTVTKVTIYRAPVTVSTISQKFLNWPEWSNWQLGHNHLPIAEVAPGAVYTVQTSTAEYFNAATFPYPAPTASNFCKFKPLNNALARMSVAWYNRTNTLYQLLLINTESRQYWKGYLVKMSSCFELGPGATDDKAASFTLAVTEQGSCLIDALTAPNTAANFSTITRVA